MYVRSHASWQGQLDKWWRNNLPLWLDFKLKIAIICIDLCRFQITTWSQMPGTPSTLLIPRERGNFQSSFFFIWENWDLYLDRHLQCFLLTVLSIYQQYFTFSRLQITHHTIFSLTGSFQTESDLGKHSDVNIMMIPGMFNPLTVDGKSLWLWELITIISERVEFPQLSETSLLNLSPRLQVEDPDSRYGVTRLCGRILEWKDTGNTRLY